MLTEDARRMRHGDRQWSLEGSNHHMIKRERALLVLGTAAMALRS